jgi:hypothetical protein
MSISQIFRLFHVEVLVIILIFSKESISQNAEILVLPTIQHRIICDSLQNTELDIVIQNLGERNFYLFENYNLEIKVFKSTKNKDVEWTSAWKSRELFCKQSILNNCIKSSLSKKNIYLIRTIKSTIISENKENKSFEYCAEFLNIDRIIPLPSKDYILIQENINSLIKTDLKKGEIYLISIELQGKWSSNKDCKDVILPKVNGYEWIDNSVKVYLYFDGVKIKTVHKADK